jgi:hypothetical protein
VPAIGIFAIKEMDSAMTQFSSYKEIIDARLLLSVTTVAEWGVLLVAALTAFGIYGSFTQSTKVLNLYSQV